jgi:hypothetical protein
MVHLPIQKLFIMARRNEQPTCENCSNRMRSFFCDLHGEELESLNDTKGCGDYKKGQIISCELLFAVVVGLPNSISKYRYYIFVN